MDDRDGGKRESGKSVQAVRPNNDDVLDSTPNGLMKGYQIWHEFLLDLYKGFNMKKCVLYSETDN